MIGYGINTGKASMHRIDINQPMKGYGINTEKTSIHRKDINQPMKGYGINTGKASTHSPFILSKNMAIHLYRNENEKKRRNCQRDITPTTKKRDFENLEVFKRQILLLVKSSKMSQVQNVYTLNNTAPTRILSKKYM